MEASQSMSDVLNESFRSDPEGTRRTVATASRSSRGLRHCGLSRVVHPDTLRPACCSPGPQGVASLKQKFDADMEAMQRRYEMEIQELKKQKETDIRDLTASHEQHKQDVIAHAEHFAAQEVEKAARAKEEEYRQKVWVDATQLAASGIYRQQTRHTACMGKRCAWRPSCGALLRSRCLSPFPIPPRSCSRTGMPGSKLKMSASRH